MRYDVVTSRKDKDGKWRNTKIGAAFPQDDGRISIVLDALPISIWEGQVRMTLFEAKPKDDGDQRPTSERAQTASRRQRGDSNQELDDDVPF